MAEYKVDVTTGNTKFAGTMDYIYITLIGTKGQSKKTELDNFGVDFMTGTTGTYVIKNAFSLGKLLLVKVEKDPNYFLPEDEWYCSKIEVTTPEGDVVFFPCFRWVSSGELVELRGGRAMKVFEDDHPVLVNHRKKELAFKKSVFTWRNNDKELPHSINFSISELPAEMHISANKLSAVKQEQALLGAELVIKGLLGSTEQWESIEDMKKIFWFKKTPISDYVADHWKEDDFYGSLFLNSVNPRVIERCTQLPPNFPVTEEMVKPFLESGSSLEEEMKKGNIFIFHQRKMDGITPRMHNNERLCMATGYCLFYVNPEKKLMPIAIQIDKQPSQDNPIFLPSDSETDWLLAKMFIKVTYNLEHQAVGHLLNTHLLAEAYALAAIRCFAVIHPIYKLLIPHFRDTFQINMGARKNLLAHNGPFSQSTVGLDGSYEVMKRGLAETTYTSLCLPDNITARGLESIPNFYYRDDGLKLWNIINSFVKAVVEHYYPSDNDVRKDSELQDWISEIFNHGFLGKKSSGIPDSFNSVKEVIKFITMVIFTVSGQHAAVNNGQYDYQSFVPNGTMFLCKPRPTTKGQTSMTTILETLPNIAQTVSTAALLFVLSAKYSDVVPIGAYPEERFDESAPKQMMMKFQAELSSLSETIKSRNSQLKLPYTYLDPAQIESSIAI